MMSRALIFFAAVLAMVSAFNTFPKMFSKRTLSMSFNLDKALNSLARNKILTKTSELGVLSKLEKSGLTLKKAAPLLVLADDLDLLGVADASKDKVLPLLDTAIDAAPALLPVAKTAINTSPITLVGGAVASAGAAYVVVSSIPDDNVSNIALQTAIAFPLGILLPVALLAGSAILSKLK